MNNIINILYLEISLENNILAISASERSKGEEHTILYYEKIPISIELVNSRCIELIDTLNKANKQGMMTSKVLRRVKEIGEFFHDELFPINIKEKLKSTTSEDLCLILDAQLVHLPWELLNDGRQFLCRRFNMGRIVKTCQTAVNLQSRIVEYPINMMIIADPNSNLKGAYKEGINLRNYLDIHSNIVRPSLLTDNIFVDSIREKIRNFDFVHFAGHAEYNPENLNENGWQLSNGVFKAKEIMKMAGTASMPSFIFSNACQSARNKEWKLTSNFQNEIFGLANVFLMTGVKHYLGTFWEIIDEQGTQFASDFYKHLISGKSIGEALRYTRNSSASFFGEQNISWASYVLYGDPTSKYFDNYVVNKKSDGKKKFSCSNKVRAKGKSVYYKKSNVYYKYKKKFWITAIIFSLSIFTPLYFGKYPILFDSENAKYKQLALASYSLDDYNKAVKRLQVLSEEKPNLSLSSVLLGNLCFFNNDLVKAQNNFQVAINAKKGSDASKADALIGLGRIASVRNDISKASDYYKQAIKIKPEKKKAYIYQALLLNRDKKINQALNLINTAKSILPDDESILAISKEFMKKVEIANDKKKQKQIDKIIKDLIKNSKKSDYRAVADTWTSLPLTIWLMDFGNIGNSLQEGEKTLVHSYIANCLINQSRAKIVERAIIGELLKELKIGSSKLSDKNISLKLGKIMAARLIISGNIIHTRSNAQIVIKVIDTQSSEIIASDCKIFKHTARPEHMAAEVSGLLIKHINTAYPLQGKISGIKKNKIILNIGKNHGVKTGGKFRMVSTNQIVKVTSVDLNKSCAISINKINNILPDMKFMAETP